MEKFLKGLQLLGEKVEVVVHTRRSKQFVDEVMKWIDGNNLIKHRLYGVSFEEGTDGVVQGHLARDIETMF